jgi:hypothetical protein
MLKKRKNEDNNVLNNNKMHVKDLPKRCSQIPIELIIYVLKNRVTVLTQVRAQVNTKHKNRNKLITYDRNSD